MLVQLHYLLPLSFGLACLPLGGLTFSQQIDHVVSPEVSVLLRSNVAFPAFVLVSAEVSVLHESRALVSTEVSVLRETQAFVSAEVSVAYNRCIPMDPADDCDGNGIHDDCELATGDANHNGILDVCELAPEVFIRGDANLDQQVDTGDVVTILGYLYSNGTVPCVAALDTNDSETVTLADAFHLLCYLFGCGPVPSLPPPHPGCGTDPTLGSLPCTATPGGCP